MAQLREKCTVLLGYIKPIRFPIVGFLKEWKNVRTVQQDVIAGLTIGVFLIPQGLALGTLAGLPPANGLYSAIVPLLIYTVFATSRQGAMGPVALNSMLTYEILVAVEPEPGAGRVGLAMVLTLLSGALQVLGAVVGLGAVVNLLSESVIGGFTCAAGLQIILSQVKDLFALKTKSATLLHDVVRQVILGFGQADWATLWAALIGIPVFLVCYYIKKVFKGLPPWVPTQLILMAICTLVAYLGKLSELEHPVPVIGYIPQGPPIPTVPPVQRIPELIPGGFVLAVVSYMQHISVTKAIAKKTDHVMHPNQELYACGLSNVGACFFGVMPTCAGFARTVLNNASGAQTPLAGFVSGLLVICIVLFMTQLFFYLPKACLAGIIVASGIGLVDFQEPRQLWRKHPEDAFVWIATFLGTLFLGIQLGVGISIVVSWVMAVKFLALPRHVVLGRVPNSTEFRALVTFPENEVFDGIVCWRFDCPLFFANVQVFKDAVDGVVRKYAPNCFVLDARAIVKIDAAAETALRDVVKSLRAKNVIFCMAHLRVFVRNMMSPELVELIGLDHMFWDNNAAVQWYHQQTAPAGTQVGTAADEAQFGSAACPSASTDIVCDASDLEAEAGDTGHSINLELEDVSHGDRSSLDQVCSERLPLDADEDIAREVD